MEKKLAFNKNDLFTLSRKKGEMSHIAAWFIKYKKYY